MVARFRDERDALLKRLNTHAWESVNETHEQVAPPIVKDIYAHYFKLQPGAIQGGVQRVDADANLQ